VIAIDIDAEKIRIAKHNATIYGVESKIDFIVGDFLQLSKSLKVQSMLAERFPLSFFLN
jgi:trimethylguanosine synthase